MARASLAATPPVDQLSARLVATLTVAQLRELLQEQMAATASVLIAAYKPAAPVEQRRYTTAEVAERLRISDRYVRHLIRSRRLAATRVGSRGHSRISQDALDAFIKANTDFAARDPKARARKGRA